MNAQKLEKLLNITLSDKQRQVLACQTRKVCLMGLEGSGKSFVSYVLVLDTVLTGLTSVFFVCPSARQARDKQTRLCAMLDNAGLTEVLKRNIGYLMEFRNGSRIHFVSAEQKTSSIKGFHSQFGKAKSGAVCVLIDDATAVRMDFADSIITTTFTASDYRLILAYNATDTSSWVYSFHTAQERGIEDTKTFTFKPSDNPRANTEVIKSLKQIDERYEQRFSGGWDSNKLSAFPPDMLNHAVDDTYSLNLPADPKYSYMMGCDLNDPLGNSVGRDRDSAVFVTIGKKIEQDRWEYKVAGVEQFQRATVQDWCEAIKRQMNLYPIDKILIESPHASGLLELLKREGFGDRVQLCNPHIKSDTFSLSAGYSYLTQCLQGRILRIPHDYTALLKEMRELRVEMTESRQLRFYHKKHGHNDHVVALCWALLGLREVERTGSVDYGVVLAQMSRGKSRPSAGNDGFLNQYGKYDREFLSLPSDRDFAV